MEGPGLQIKGPAAASPAPYIGDGWNIPGSPSDAQELGDPKDPCDLFFGSHGTKPGLSQGALEPKRL